ncbi:unnamed protein product [Nyctereutes procyonoides]|uniref:(raccoon dog) hypothetical protein n=1 Tax=Nyctereutes procyonoides TaxID=34880 RepID=A0A811Y857_NYCPR|nr:unnamed protein product [Nyctereutes procyonoides]
MATIQQLVGRWRLVESKGFDEYMKEVGVGMALRKVGAMAKPDCIISSDGKNLTIKTESTLKTTQFSCNLGEKFEETTADGRKTQVSHKSTKITEVGIPGWHSGLAPAFGPGRDPGDPGSNSTSGSRCMEPASPSAYVSAPPPIINKLKKNLKKSQKFPR